MWRNFHNQSEVDNASSPAHKHSSSLLMLMLNRSHLAGRYRWLIGKSSKANILVL